MRPILTILFLSAALAIAGTALATDPPDGAVINERVYNDCPTTTLTSTNSYATLISIHEQKFLCNPSGVNRHNWRFASGGSAVQFSNNDGFRFCADMTITGTSLSEAGLQISPWWSSNVDGVFMCNANSGEIACFGGRLPFYSFTGSHGVNYTMGETVHMEISYLPHMLSEAEPGTIEYSIVLGGTPYSSGPLAFDMGNPAEPYGLWGILHEAQAGGYFQSHLWTGGDDGWAQTEWANICFEDLGTVANENSTWGGVKALYQ